MLTRPRYRPRLLRTLIAPAIRRGGAFADDERGVTAIEFGILALPFFTIIFAILETTLIFFAGQILDTATADASRLIRTGQAQAANYTSDNFRAEICERLYGLFDCQELRIRVDVVDNFTAATITNVTETDEDCDPECDWTIVQNYNPGAGSQVILVQAYYKWPAIVNLPWFDLRNQPDGVRLLAGVRVFKNEPF
ncbi:TadE/TadG family type IV pilus assembly protein [Devosia sp.]|uniref:TadE/TadG family type IV pilus assembly protein n=1 Tax=Devosia sp. TaxID=1871048 RepID=UPI003A916F35